MSERSALHSQVLGIAWLEPWAPLSEERAARFERMLSRELVSGHPLAGRTVCAIAARSDTDDVLYWVANPDELAVVHLSHKKPVRFDAASCMRFESVASFVEGCLQPDHLEHTESEDG